MKTIIRIYLVLTLVGLCLRAAVDPRTLTYPTGTVLLGGNPFRVIEMDYSSNMMTFFPSENSPFNPVAGNPDEVVVSVNDGTWVVEAPVTVDTVYEIRYAVGEVGATWTPWTEVVIPAGWRRKPLGINAEPNYTVKLISTGQSITRKLWFNIRLSADPIYLPTAVAALGRSSAGDSWSASIGTFLRV